MSLTVDGVWKVGVWATTVWADGVWFEGAAVSPTTTGAAWSKGKKLRKGGLRWADFSTKEERQLALAQALAVEAVPIGDPDDEIIEAEDRLIIALVLSKVIH